MQLDQRRAFGAEAFPFDIIEGADLCEIADNLGIGRVGLAQTVTCLDKCVAGFRIISR